MKLRFWWLTVFPLMFASLAQAASFDCQLASHPDEQAICKSRALSEMDVEMSVRYETLIGLVAMGTRGDMQEEQRAFLQKRAQCGANQACLHAAYDARIETLKKEYEQLKSRGPF
jgi:uncharacterized protein